MNKLLYIASLPHSGSTLLNLLVGNHPGMVGLGGIDRAVRLVLEKPQETAAMGCSCGQTVRDCAYWGKVFEACETSRPDTMPGRYELALQVFASVYGEDKWAVDSSKTTEPIKTLGELADFDLRIIHLAKDYRSSNVSLVESEEHKKRQKGLSSQPRAVLATKSAWRWYRENQKIRDRVSGLGLRLAGVGYEELCLNHQEAISIIAGLADLPPAEISANTNDSQTHLFIGNRMRDEKEKATLSYDYRWFFREYWRWPMVLLPFVGKRNHDWVYGNNIDKWSRKRG